MKILNFKKFFWLAFLMLAFSFHIASAETAIPENLAPLAKEMGCQTKEECAKAFDSNFEKGIELAEKYQVYSKEQSDIAKSYKQEVISKLSGLSEENFEEEIVKIAKELLKKPKLAKSFQLDKDSVSAAETIVAEVKNAGVGVDICSQSAETLSREQLIGCLEASKKLAKKTSVQKYIPKGVIEKTNMADMAASLDEALARGDYSELGKTAEEAGQKCLKSGSESLKACDEVAQKFFGPEGVKELTAARTQTKQAGDFYLKNLENMELITPDGRKIAGKTAIKNACDGAFETKDIKLARACGDFAVKNGFTGKEEMEESLNLFESMASKNINFDDCRSNPEICEEFIPEEHKQEFEGNKKIYEIMKAEAGFNPIECERGNVDFEIGRKCFEASKKALPKLKEIAKDYPEVQRMVSEIESGLKRETEQSQKGDDFEKFFSQQAGPGGCKTEQECFAYCNDSAHGAECISFGAKHEVFQGDEAVERYQRYNDILKSPSPSNYNQTGQYGENRFNQGGQAYPYPTSENRGAYVNTGGFGGSGPSPECFVAIQSGDFAKAKEICNTPANPYQYQPPQNQQQKPLEQMVNYQQSSAPINRICPATPEFDCQSGYQKIYKTTPDGCGISECVYVGGNSQSSSYSSYYPPSSYSSYSYSSPGYTGSCPSDLASLLGSGCHYMYNDNSGNRIYCNGEMTKSAKYGDTAMTEGCASTGGYNYSSYPSSAYSSYSYSSYTYTPPSGQREQVWNNYGLRSWIRTDADSARIENLKQVCANVTSSAWDIWMSGAGDYNSQNFGMPDEAKCRAWTPGSQSSYSSSSYSYSSYPSSAYSSYSYSSYPSSYSSSYSYSSYSSTSSCPTNLLGSGCHDMGSAYFNGPMDQYVVYGGSTVKSCATEYMSGCSTGGSYSSYSSYSSYPSSAYSSYSYSSYPSSAYSSYSYSSYDASASCAQYGGIWNGSYCQYGSSSSYSSVSSAASSYSSYDYSTACSQAGGTWNGSYCQMPNTASSAAAYSSSSADMSAACAQAGGTWDGTACQMPSSSSSSAATQNPAAAGWFLQGIINFFSR